MKILYVKKSLLILPLAAILLFSSSAFGNLKKINSPSISVTFRVDMTYQYEKGAFNPLTDTLDVPGTMNAWAGSSRMTFSGTYMTYEYTYILDSNSIQQYKFRINGNWATSEFPNGGPNRMYLVRNQNDSITSYYNDYQPGTVPITFKCHMGYQMLKGTFIKATDWLDIAGNFNNWGAYDVLFDRGNDSVYVIKLNMDTTYFNNQPPLEFKFRINGNWATSEFPDGGPNRVSRLEDTTGGYQNIVDVWYNNEDPAIPTPPLATNVDIQGNLTVGETLTGVYTYTDINGDLEGSSRYNWFRADSVTQPEPEEIAGVMSVNYVLTEADVHKFIAFQVAPVSATGNPNMGSPVRKWSTVYVSGVGIDESGKNPVRLYPNPVGDILYVENPGNIEKIDIFNVIGNNLISLPVTHNGKFSINTSGLENGIYFIRFHHGGNVTSTSKFVKK